MQFRGAVAQRTHPEVENRPPIVLMSNPFTTDSPQYYLRLRTDLRDFRNEYVSYINRTAASVEAGGSVAYDAERAHIIDLAIRADRAVGESGSKLAWMAPPAMSAPPLYGLALVAFAHESEVYRGFSGMKAPRSYEAVLDAVDRADAILAIRQDELLHRRRSPFYWVDRVLRAVLSLPAYIISIIFGFRLEELSATQGRVWWWVSILADLATIAALGRAFGWW